MNEHRISEYYVTLPRWLPTVYYACRIGPYDERISANLYTKNPNVPVKYLYYLQPYIYPSTYNP